MQTQKRQVSALVRTMEWTVEFCEHGPGCFQEQILSTAYRIAYIYVNYLVEAAHEKLTTGLATLVQKKRNYLIDLWSDLQTDKLA